MKRLVALLLSLTASGCAGSMVGAAPEEDAKDTVGFRAHLEVDSPTLVDMFQAHAEHYGCETIRREGDRVGERCREGSIALFKEGLEVSVYCPHMTIEGCKALFDRIVDTK
jgi:hypothetical protein